MKDLTREKANRKQSYLWIARKHVKNLIINVRKTTFPNKRKAEIMLNLKITDIRFNCTFFLLDRYATQHWLKREVSWLKKGFMAWCHDKQKSSIFLFSSTCASFVLLLPAQGYDNESRFSSQMSRELELFSNIQSVNSKATTWFWHDFSCFWNVSEQP